MTAAADLNARSSAPTRVALVLLGLSLAIAWCVSAAAADAVVLRAPGHHFIGVLARGDGPGVGASATDPLKIAATTRAVNHDFPSGYAALVEQYLGDVAHDSGGTQNAYGVAAQYGPGVAPDLSRRYAVSFDPAADVLSDTDPYPADRDAGAAGAGHDNAQGCVPDAADSLGDPAYTWCLTDAQIQSELVRAIAAHGWPAAGNGAIYFVFLPAQIDVCSQPSSRSCAGQLTGFCAYHSVLSGSQGTLLYAVLPYVDVYGCRSGEAPNGGAGAAGDDPGDDELTVLSHEHNETIDDPLGNAWLSPGGEESADLCAGNPNVYGAPLGGSPGAEYNQVIGGHHYWLQDEFADVDPARPGAFDSCEQRPGAPADGVADPSDAGPLAYFGGPVVGAHTAYAIFWNPAGPAVAPVAQITTPSSTRSGLSTSFDASGSLGSNLTYSWNFGDGQSASGVTATHVYQAPGDYTVTLTVQDAVTSYTGHSQQLIAVAAGPTAAFSVAGGATVGTPIGFDASASSDPTSTISGFQWSFGDGDGSIASTTDTAAALATHTYAAAGSYTVTLTVSDAGGASATASQTVVVGTPGAPGLPVGPGGPGSGGGDSTGGDNGVSAAGNNTRAAQGATNSSAGRGSAAPRPRIVKTAAPRLVVGARKRLRLISGRQAQCPPGGVDCRVTVTISARVSTTSTVHHHRKTVTRTVTLGTLHVALDPGHKLALSLPLSSSGAALVRKAGRVRAALKIVARGAGSAQASRTLGLTLASPVRRR